MFCRDSNSFNRRYAFFSSSLIDRFSLSIIYERDFSFRRVSLSSVFSKEDFSSFFESVSTMFSRLVVLLLVLLPGAI